MNSSNIMKNKMRSRMKGQNFSIKTMALIVLGIMVVVLVYGAFSGWFDNAVGQFASGVQYPNPSS